MAASKPSRRSHRPLVVFSTVMTVLSGAWAFALRSRPSKNGGPTLTPQQLTGRLRTAETSNHVLFMVEQYENNLNEYHVRAALTRLAQSNGTAALSEDPGFRKLLSRTSELVTTFRSQALATVLWSLARVEYDPGEAFLRSVIDASLPQLKQSKPQDMVNSLWACARFGYQPCEAFLEALVDTCANTLDDFEPMDVANLLWSFARLGFQPQKAFLDAVVARSLEMVNSFSPVDIANLLWAFAKLKVDAGETLRPLLQQAEEQVDSFEPAKLASLLWSCNKLQLDPGLPLLRALPCRTNRELTELRPRGLSYVLWVYGLLGHNPGTAFLQRVMEKLSRTVPAFDYCGAQGLSGILWSCARFNYDPGEEQVAALLSSSQQQLLHFTPAQLTRLLWACAKLQRRPSEDFLEAWLTQAERHLQDFESEELLLCQRSLKQLNFTRGELPWRYNWLKALLSVNP